MSRAEELSNAHWEYNGKFARQILLLANVPEYEINEITKYTEFIYKAVAKHFYGHGREDERNGVEP